MPSRHDDKVWFITGTSTGFGRAIAERLIDRGDTVVATARDAATIADLAATGGGTVLALPLDVTDTEAVHRAVDRAVSAFGRIDVLVNNAGYGLRGAVEEQTEADLRHQFETNVFGVLTVTRAVLPIMRARRDACPGRHRRSAFRGHIVQMSSVGGVSATLGGTMYATTKFALEGLSEGLAQEVAHLGIGVTIVEPGPFRTDFAGRSIRWAQPMDDYAPVLAPERERFAAQHGRQPGDPKRAAAAIIAAVEHDEPPLRLPLGRAAFRRIRADLNRRLAELDEAEPLGADTDFASS